jgi:hypothetical protein
MGVRSPAFGCTGRDRKRQEGKAMSDQPNHAVPPTEGTYIAHLWEYPQLTIAIFGMQAHTPEAFALYEAEGIPQQMDASLAKAEGLLGVRAFEEGNGALLLQYWRSHDAPYRVVEVAQAQSGQGIGILPRDLPVPDRRGRLRGWNAAGGTRHLLHDERSDGW